MRWLAVLSGSILCIIAVATLLAVALSPKRRQVALDEGSSRLGMVALLISGLAFVYGGLTLRPLAYAVGGLMLLLAAALSAAGMQRAKDPSDQVQRLRKLGKRPGSMLLHPFRTMRQLSRRD